MTRTEPRTPQSLRIAAGAVLGLIFVLALPSVRLILFNPRNYYTYGGTIGPLEAIRNADGTVTAGRPISTIHPGESFVWVRRLCFVADVDVLSIIELRQEATNKIVSRHEFETTPEDRHCADRTIEVAIPVDAEPGLYSADRRLIIEPHSGSPTSAQLPPVEIEVVPK